jgi:hypothetical protein
LGIVLRAEQFDTEPDGGQATLDEAAADREMLKA